MYNLKNKYLECIINTFIINKDHFKIDHFHQHYRRLFAIHL